MKRIYMTMALLGGLAFGAKAQVADLEAFVLMDDNTCLEAGKVVSNDTTVQPFGIWGVFNNGPESLIVGDKVNYIFPRSTVSETGASVFYAELTETAPAEDYAFASTGLPVDSIRTLLNIDSFNAGVNQFSSLLVPRASLVTNKIYGFYLYVIGTGEDINAPDNQDTVGSNNFAFVPVKWNCTQSIAEMIKGAARENITVYPNPSRDEISFDYDFAKASTAATVRVTDLTGRTLVVKDFGKNSFGKKKFTINVANLPVGSYILEFTTDEKRGISKFNVQK